MRRGRIVVEFILFLLLLAMANYAIADNGVIGGNYTKVIQPGAGVVKGANSTGGIGTVLGKVNPVATLSIFENCPGCISKCEKQIGNSKKLCKYECYQKYPKDSSCGYGVSIANCQQCLSKCPAEEPLNTACIRSCNAQFDLCDKDPCTKEQKSLACVEFCEVNPDSLSCGPIFCKSDPSSIYCINYCKKNPKDSSCGIKGLYENCQSCLVDCPTGEPQRTTCLRSCSAQFDSCNLKQLTCDNCLNTCKDYTDPAQQKQCQVDCKKLFPDNLACNPNECEDCHSGCDKGPMDKLTSCYSNCNEKISGCTPTEDLCKADPGSLGCMVYCSNYPASDVCKLDCIKNPKDPVCVAYCSKYPTSVECGGSAKTCAKCLGGCDEVPPDKKESCLSSCTGTISGCTLTQNPCEDIGSRECFDYCEKYPDSSFCAFDCSKDPLSTICIKYYCTYNPTSPICSDDPNESCATCLNRCYSAPVIEQSACVTGCKIEKPCTPTSVPSFVRIPQTQLPPTTPASPENPRAVDLSIQDSGRFVVSVTTPIPLPYNPGTSSWAPVSNTGLSSNDRVVSGNSNGGSTGENAFAQGNVNTGGFTAGGVGLSSGDRVVSGNSDSGSAGVIQINLPVNVNGGSTGSSPIAGLAKSGGSSSGDISGVFRPSFMSNSTNNQSTTNKTGKNVTMVVRTVNVTPNVTKK